MAFFSTLAEAKPLRFEVKDAIQRDIVQFVSEAPLEKVVGLTSAVSGWVEVDPQKLSDGVKGEFEVDVRNFDTGNLLRNDHLREKFLFTSEFPVATFSFSKLSNSSKTQLPDQQSVVLRVEGTMKIKGVSKPLAVLLKTTYFKQSDMTNQRLGGNLLRVSSSFDLDLQNFGIMIPEGLKFKLARYVQVSVDVVGSDGRPPAIVPIGETDKNK